MALLSIGCSGDLRPIEARFTLGAPCASVSASGFQAQELRFVDPPQMTPGPAGSWDDVDVLNPSVLRFGGRFLNVYSGFDGETWRTGVATSEDGVEWTRAAESALEPEGGWEGAYIAANGAAVEGADGRLRYWYQAGPRNRTSIGLAVSGDGAAWRRVGEGPVLKPGAAGDWDESAVGDPYAIRCGETYYLFYLGQNRFGVQRLGVARSDDGAHWQKSHLNPVLEPGGLGAFDERGLGEPAVFAVDGQWRMVYTGRDGEEVRRLGWAVSDDGVRWRKAGPVHTGEADWNTLTLCDPSVWIDEGRVRLWYGGGDTASPDENLNGAIGEAAY